MAPKVPSVQQITEISRAEDVTLLSADKGQEVALEGPELGEACCIFELSLAPVLGRQDSRRLLEQSWGTRGGVQNPQTPFCPREVFAERLELSRSHLGQ